MALSARRVRAGGVPGRLWTALRRPLLNAAGQADETLALAGVQVNAGSGAAGIVLGFHENLATHTWSRGMPRGLAPTVDVSKGSAWNEVIAVAGLREHTPRAMP
jgi:hypothetical protein